MTEINKHGLSRYVPESIQREIRKNSFFGCVICGAGICAIDHVDPEFKDAKKHDPIKMTLLCDSCHGKKTRGIIGVNTVKKAMLYPYCETNEHPSDFLDFGNSEPKVQFGNTLFHNPKSLISIDGVSILSIKEPQVKNDDRYLLNAVFHNLKGEESFKIVDNVWIGNIDNWDIQTKGKMITIRSKKRSVLLKIENIPEDRFVVHKLNMIYKGYSIQADNDGVAIITPSNKEILILDTGGNVRGDTVVNIWQESILFENLEIDNTNFDFSNGMMINCTFVGDSGIHIGKGRGK